MFEIDKNKFGSFIASLRKEQGLTQKELAEKLFISDKAISKWETGYSLPDITLLIPLSETLNVNVSELLTCRKMEKNEQLNSKQVEEIIHKTIQLNQKEVITKKFDLKVFVILIIGLAEGSIFFCLGLTEITMIPFTIISFVLGYYFFFVISEVLPNYYDENKVYVYSNRFFRIHLPIPLNNNNWTFILQYVRAWAIVSIYFMPILSLFFKNNLSFIILIVYLVTLYVPIIYQGKKYD